MKQLTNLLTKQGLTIAMIASATLGAAAAMLIVSGAAQADTIAIEPTPTGVYHETVSENDQLYTQPAAMKYESTEEYLRWLHKINELCKQQYNPTEDRVGFWDCLEEEKQRDPPPENHLKPQG